MKLTYDTLLHIISLTGYAKDSVQLMATCRVLYHEGAKIALKKPITIFNEERLASFLQFLRAENLSRCRYLKQLELRAFYPGANVVHELIETLPLLVNIEYLRLPSAEELLGPYHAALPPAFAALTSLRHVDISGAKKVTCGLLSALQSPLISMRIDFLSNGDQKLWDLLAPDQWPKYHPTKLLANFAPTLEELYCVAWYTTQDTIIPAKVYPNMRKLAIELDDFPLRIDPFIRAFPNVTDLHVDTNYHGGSVAPWNLEAMRESHRTNISQQLGVGSCGTWVHLEHFYGYLVDLYAIGLTCHIPRVTILDNLGAGSRTDMLATVLRYARPVHLKLTGITGSMLGNSERGFISMLRDASASNLINLDVCIYFGKEDLEKDLGAIVGDLFLALGLLPLKFLEIRFYTNELDPTPNGPSTITRMMRIQQGLPEPPQPNPAPLTPAELSLNALDMDALVARLAESLTTLEAAHYDVNAPLEQDESTRQSVQAPPLEFNPFGKRIVEGQGARVAQIARLKLEDSVQLMATCRVLHHEGAKIALKKPITIFNEEQLASFLQFLRAENLSRCRYLKQLELWAFYPEADVVQELIETLPLLVNIGYLRLVSAEDFLELYPALLPAFSALTSLRHINFSGAKAVTCELLSSLQSPLISVHIDFLPDDDVKLWDHLDLDQWPKYHPTTLLANFASTLEELQCAAWYTTWETVIPEKVYPNLRKLSIELHEFPLRIDPFIRAFPNLIDLSVLTEYHGGDMGDFALENMGMSHDTNVDQQLSSCGTWAHLEHFSGCLVDLYAIGLTCHIPRVTILGTLHDGPRADILATVLRYTKPLHLKLEGITGSLLGDLPDQGFISMLREEGASNLVNLDVQIYFGKDDREKDVRIAIDNLVSALAHLRLKFLELRFHTYDLDPTPSGPSTLKRMMCRQQGLPEPPEPIPAPLTPAEVSLNALDMDALIARLESIPSLGAALVVLPSSRHGGDWKDHERTITKGASRLAGREQ
ncbi:hypothetical protein LXA43DRAFT_904125 [Ganoderma leucocontextum]|nr:hypothetical protein LXA43DRAFT_904125 [Ganoderma leucocontextum]